jgi:hypothetical protein
MIVSSILGAAALMAIQADLTRAPRDAYTSCLGAFVKKSVEEKTTLETFAAALPQQCTQQENAYRSAIRARETGFKTPAAQIDEIIKEEVEDARENMKGRFEMHQPRST